MIKRKLFFFLSFKTEILKLKNKHLSYYCKNDICVEIERESLP